MFVFILQSKALTICTTHTPSYRHNPHLFYELQDTLRVLDLDRLKSGDVSIALGILTDLGIRLMWAHVSWLRSWPPSYRMPGGRP